MTSIITELTVHMCVLGPIEAHLRVRDFLVALKTHCGLRFRVFCSLVGLLSLMTI